jgi:hypothetical protein
MMLANNTNLPELPFWQARSFWAQLLLVASVLANAAGFDLFGALREMGIGSNPDEVMATVTRIGSALQVLSPIAFGVWAWLERRAPNFRLVFWKAPPEITMLGFWAGLAIGLVVLAGARAALADPPRCVGQTDALADLKARFGEDLRWSGLTTTGQLLAITLAPDGTTWTAMAIMPDGRACLIAAGESWAEKPAEVPGEDG